MLADTALKMAVNW